MQQPTKKIILEMIKQYPYDKKADFILFTTKDIELIEGLPKNIQQETVFCTAAKNTMWLMDKKNVYWKD